MSNITEKFAKFIHPDILGVKYKITIYSKLLYLVQNHAHAIDV